MTNYNIESSFTVDTGLTAGLYNFRTSSRTSERDLKIFRLNIHFCLVHLPMKKYCNWISKYDFLAIFTYEATATFTVSKYDTIFDGPT